MFKTEATNCIMNNTDSLKVNTERNLKEYINVETQTPSVLQVMAERGFWNLPVARAKILGGKVGITSR